MWELVNMGLPAYILPIMGKTIPSSFENLYSNNLDGVDEWVLKSSEAALQTAGISYSCWIKTTQAGFAAIMSQYKWGGGLTYYGSEMAISSGTLVVAGGNGSQTFVVSATTFNDGNWHHIVATLNATQYRGYIDGVLVATTNAGGYSPVSCQFAIGREAETSAFYPFSGKIANPAIIGRVITLAEVEAAYALKMGDLRTLFGTDLKFGGYFPNGTSDYPSWIDYSGNGYDMTMTNQESADINTDVPT